MFCTWDQTSDTLREKQGQNYITQGFAHSDDDDDDCGGGDDHHHHHHQGKMGATHTESLQVQTLIPTT